MWKHYTSEDFGTDTIFKLFTNCMFSVQRDILQEIRDRELKETPCQAPRISTEKELNSAARGKLRYVAGYVTAKLKYRNSNTIRSSLFVPRKIDVLRLAEMKKTLMENLTVSESDLLSVTCDPKSLEETSWRQNVSSGLTNISDETFNFFTLLELQTRGHLTEKSLLQHKSEFFSVLEKTVLDDPDLIASFATLFKADIQTGHENPESCQLCETCDICRSVRELFKSFVSLFVKVSVSQFRKDFLEGLKI
jgi:hypothetical protein